ncbi:unnamed protein product, partial [Symbiodinium necroappetens]
MASRRSGTRACHTKGPWSTLRLCLTSLHTARRAYGSSSAVPPNLSLPTCGSEQRRARNSSASPRPSTSSWWSKTAPASLGSRTKRALLLAPAK